MWKKNESLRNVGLHGWLTGSLTFMDDISHEEGNRMNSEAQNTVICCLLGRLIQEETRSSLSLGLNTIE